MRVIFFLSIFIFFSNMLMAQDGESIEKFYDYKWKETNDISNASYYSSIEKTDSGWSRNDYYIHSKKLQMHGIYEDSNTAIPNGTFFYFYSNGNIESTGKYAHGKKEGGWVIYFFDGEIKESITYKNNNPVGLWLSWHSNGILNDSCFFDENGNGAKYAWFSNGSIASVGYLKSYDFDGEWKYFHLNRRLASLETYKNGIEINREDYDENGSLLKDTVQDTKAGFAKGVDAWNNYMARQLYMPTGYKIVNSDKAIVVISCTIDENGNVIDTYVKCPFNPKLDEIALSAIKNSPKWLPTIKHNQPVRAELNFPIAARNVHGVFR